MTLQTIRGKHVLLSFIIVFLKLIWYYYRHNSAVGEREELERELRNLRENVDECTLTRVDLERKLLTLREELEFENMVHQEVSFFFLWLRIILAESKPTVIFNDKFRSLTSWKLSWLLIMFVFKSIHMDQTCQNYYAIFGRNTNLRPRRTEKKRKRGIILK